VTVSVSLLVNCVGGLTWLVFLQVLAPANMLEMDAWEEEGLPRR